MSARAVGYDAADLRVLAMDTLKSHVEDEAGLHQSMRAIKLDGWCEAIELSPSTCGLQKYRCPEC
jgi:hypothetical protein